MDKKTQNATILDMIQYDWNLDTIKEWFGELPPDVNYEQNILAVLNDIQAENGYYFMHRQDVNPGHSRQESCYCRHWKFSSYRL